ncbi:Reverse transcriptase (RNA-dependent DNA polymerase) [Fragilaria crotonensis]|nr:Reverse transcriptase (RNA-dependent DNA polymerase) [Fragilaria crotonensis]
MQLRLNDVKVNDVPRFLTENPDELTHSLVVPMDDAETPYVIPLSLKGVASSFPTRKPTLEEYESLPHLVLTSDLPDYDPHDPTFASHEETLTKIISDSGDRISAATRLQRLCLISNTNLANPEMDRIRLSLRSISVTFDDNTLAGAVRQTAIQTVRTTTSRKQFDATYLSKNWGIDIHTARRTVQVTTQRGIRTLLNPTLSRRFRTNDRQLRYRRLPIDCFTDTLISNTVSARNNKYAQIFATPDGWCRAFPMRKKSDAHEGLSLLFQREGVPNTFIMDGAKEQLHGQFRKKCREAGARVKQTEPHTPWSNAAESAIRELKRGVGRQMVRSKAPKRLWDHCLEREAYVRSLTAHDQYRLEGQVPETVVRGDTADISALALFGWFEWVMFRDTSATYPDDKMILGRDLGPAVDIGPAMTRKVIKANGQVVYRSTVRSLTADELSDETHKSEREKFTNSLNKALGDSFKFEDFVSDPELEDLGTPIYEPYEDGDADEGPGLVPDADNVDEDTFDVYVGAQVLLPIGDSVMTAKVRGRKRQSDGTLRGRAHANPILDTRTYEVEFPDGQRAEVAANTIAQNMYAQCDSEGNQYLLLSGIVDYKRDDSAVSRADMWITRGSNRRMRQTTKGWHLCVEWKDGTTSWERLADLKESNPIEVAEFAVTHGIDGEAAFAWWVPYTLKRRDRIVAAVNKRYHKRTHKFGIEVPKTYEDCVRIDRENGNTLWQDAVRKEMTKVRVAFEVLEDGRDPPPTFQEMRCHLVFDIKMEDFQRKARLVAGGHMTKPSSGTVTYASVVSRESVRIALTLAALNDLEVKTADIENAYLTAPVGEKIWCRLGPEFGHDAGKRAIIVRALYGLKSAGASFRNHLADCMRHLGWQSCMADHDLWFKPEVRTEDNYKYYAYCLLYVDDILVVHHDGIRALKEIDHFFKTKDGSIRDPEFYLGAKLRPVTLPNGVVAWGMSSSKYIQAAVANVKAFHAKEYPTRKWSKRSSGPFPLNYAPELDVTPELSPEHATFYQSQIGVLRWCVELGRIDIITEVSELASYLIMPREGHLEAVFHLFNHLEKKHNARIVFDPSYPDIDRSAFKECDWKSFYGEVTEAIPPNAPPPRGKDVDIRLFVDSDHAGDQRTRRSRTGFLIYLNMSPIVWYSKKQATIETSVFGAEFVAMKHGMETLRGLRYKLRMMGVPIDGPSFIYGDNMSVIHNTQRPESTLKKKSNSVCYHAVREAVAMGECITAHISTHDNPADICTKLIPGGQRETT